MRHFSLASFWGTVCILSAALIQPALAESTSLQRAKAPISLENSTIVIRNALMTDKTVHTIIKIKTLAPLGKNSQNTAGVSELPTIELANGKQGVILDLLYKYDTESSATTLPEATPKPASKAYLYFKYQLLGESETREFQSDVEQKYNIDFFEAKGMKVSGYIRGVDVVASSVTNVYESTENTYQITVFHGEAQHTAEQPDRPDTIFGSNGHLSKEFTEWLVTRRLTQVIADSNTMHSHMNIFAPVIRKHNSKLKKSLKELTASAITFSKAHAEKAFTIKSVGVHKNSIQFCTFFLLKNDMQKEVFGFMRFTMDVNKDGKIDTVSEEVDTRKELKLSDKYRAIKSSGKTEFITIQ